MTKSDNTSLFDTDTELIKSYKAMIRFRRKVLKETDEQIEEEFNNAPLLKFHLEKDKQYFHKIIKGEI